MDFDAPSEFHNNKFVYNYYLATSNSYYHSWNISWGSCSRSNNTSTSFYSVASTDKVYRYNDLSPDGIYGPQNHKEYPAIPTITSSTIDGKTDAEGVLHVKITATAAINNHIIQSRL